MTITSTTLTISTDPTTRTARDDVSSLPAALRSEWIKISTLRSSAVLLALSAAVGGVTAWALAATASASPPPAGQLFIFPLPLVAMMAAVAGILLFTGEFQHGTLPVMLMARPARWVTVAAKALMAAAVGVGLGVTAMSSGFVGAVLGGADAGLDGTVVSRAAWAGTYIVLAALLGLGVGMIVRHSAAAISGLLMWSFVIESLFAPALPDGVLHALPFSAGYRLLDAGPEFEAPVVIEHQLSRPSYAAIFAGYAVLALVVGTVLLYVRDSD